MLKKYIGDFERFTRQAITERMKTGSFTVDDLIKDLDAAPVADVSVESKAIIKNIFNSSLKKTQDGSNFLNDIILRHKAETIHGQSSEILENIKSLKNISKTRTLSASEATTLENLQTSLKENQNIFSRITNNQLIENNNIIDFKKINVRSDLNNQTMRALLTGGQYKSQSDIVSRFDNPIVQALHELGYLGSASDELRKSEVTFGTGSRIPGAKPVETLTMAINPGHGIDTQFADIQGLIFHSDVYQEGPGSIHETINSQHKALMREIEDIKSGKVSSTVRRKLERSANLNPDNWEEMRFTSREGLEAMISEARDLQAELLTGGEDIRNIRGLNSRLVSFMQKDYYRDTKSYNRIALSRNNRPILDHRRNAYAARAEC